MFLVWWKKFINRQTRKQQRSVPRARRKRRQLFPEVLEDRNLLTTLTVGTNINIAHSSKTAPLSRAQAETTIAIDPTDLTDSRLFAATNPPPSGGTGTMFAAYSTDRGIDWTPSDLTGLPTACCDEQAAFDQFGNLFLTYLTPDPTGGSDAVVAWSANGGKSFAGHTVVDTGTDQPSIGTGHGSVWVSYQKGGSIQASGALVSGSLSGTGTVGLFSSPQIVPGSSGGSYGDTKVGPNGEVLVTYQSPSSGSGPSTIYVNLNGSGLGGTFAPPVTVTSTNVGGYTYSLPAQPNDSIDAEANLAWDRDPGSQHFGRIYLVYTDRPTTKSADTNIYVRYSDDKGTTWSPRVLVNDDGSGKSQFLPAIAVDQSTGFVAVTWYDARNSKKNNTAQIYGTVSTDGGQTWVKNVKIAAGLSNGVAAGSFNFGDYDTMDYAHGAFYRSWADNANPSLLNLPNSFLPAMTVATARVDVAVTGGFVRSGATSTDTSGNAAPVQFNPATSAGPTSTKAAGILDRDWVSLDRLFASIGEADQGGVWFRPANTAWHGADLGWADGFLTNGLAVDEIFQALGSA